VTNAIMDRLNNINPFARRDSHTTASIVTYKALTVVTWLLSVVVSVHFSFNNKYFGHHHRTIWEHNHYYFSGFTQSYIISSIYWLTLFIFQIGYITHLFSSNVVSVNAACSVGSHFIANNLLHAAWVLLFVDQRFILSEIVLLLNFVNLTALYFRHPSYPRFIHLPAVSGPLAWTFVAIYWNGAMMLVPHQNDWVARIFANIFVWSILGYGLFFIVVYKDYTMGFALSVLSASLGVAQFHRQVVAFQWIFSFTIMSVLFVMTAIVALPEWTGRDVPWGRRVTTVDTERAPLLTDP